MTRRPEPCCAPPGILSSDPERPGVLVVVIRYVDRYDRRDGDWRIADREIRFLWSERHEVVDSGF